MIERLNFFYLFNFVIHVQIVYEIKNFNLKNGSQINQRI
jgi:hypothetical protein